LEFCQSDPVISEELQKYPEKATALIIMDNHWSHTDESTIKALSEIECDISHLFPGSTDLFCVLDVGVCKPLKSFFRTQFETYCASSIASQLSAKIDSANISVNTKLSALKPLAARWMISCYNHLRENDDLIRNAWKGVNDNLRKNLPEQTTLPPPIILSTTKCVAKFIESLSCITSTSKRELPPAPSILPQAPSPVQVLINSDDDKSEEEEAVEDKNDKEEAVEDKNDQEEAVEDKNNKEEAVEDKNDKETSNNNDGTEDYDEDDPKPKSLVGRRVSVYWNDGDGHRWEQGVIKEMYSKFKFVIQYDFLLKAKEEDESVDADVIENLLGKKAVNWRYK